MVSLQAKFSQEEKKEVSPNFENFFQSIKKRKWQDGGDETNEFTTKEPKLRKEKEQANIELHLDAPFPLEWQRCLDIKSGQIHFYNTRTHKRTSKDPRSSPEPPPSSLKPTIDLELKLNMKHVEHEEGQVLRHDFAKNQCNYGNNSTKYEISLDIDRQEMVAAVCMKCHMLVMMLKASPSCPNCKFMHPQGQDPSLIRNNNKHDGKLLCCKD